jgi:hypothetical protein
VNRISLGASLHAHAMAALQRSAGALATGDLATATPGPGFGQLARVLTRPAT